jgi:geranylgeranyl diphosphate synthase type II
MQSTLLHWAPILENALLNFPIPTKPNSLYEPIRYFLNLPGKRIRPVFVLMSLSLFRKPEEMDLVPALATELFHNFSLLHDDMMDKADLRRGFQTVHTKWDEPTALLAGDALLIIAYQALIKSKTDFLSDLIQQFNAMSLAVCEGQQLDMDFSQLEIVSLEQYTNMIDRKTGALIAFSFEFGGFLGAATEAQRKALHDFGLSMGRCFQLRDDYLDLFGDEQKTGKKRGGDIGNRKLTFPILVSLQNSEFKSIWNNKQIDAQERIEKALAWMESNQVNQKVEHRIASEMESGLQLLEEVAGNEASKNALREICTALAFREK